MYTLRYGNSGLADAIEKDGQVVLDILEGSEPNTKNAENIIKTLNRVNDQEEREYFFCWILEKIHHLRCHSQIYSLRSWFMSDDENKREFRLGGKFGSGFKIRRNRDGFYFDQYPEDQTEESKKWIEDVNRELQNMTKE